MLVACGHGINCLEGFADVKDDCTATACDIDVSDRNGQAKRRKLMDKVGASDDIEADLYLEALSTSRSKPISGTGTSHG